LLLDTPKITILSTATSIKLKILICYGLDS